MKTARRQVRAMERPKCKCHDAPMRVKKGRRGKTGWTCVIRASEANRRYRNSANGKAVCARYLQTDNVKAARKLYNKSLKGLLTQKRYRERLTDAQLDRKRAQNIEYYHRKGWITSRRREVKILREKYTEQLAQLDAYIQSLLEEGFNAQS